MAARSASASSALNDQFKTETIKLRGQTYSFRELSGSQYEDCVKEAEGEDGTADLATVLKLMIPLSLTDPKWDAEKIYNLPLPVLSAIQTKVNQMHFRDEPVEAEEGEEPGPKNDSESESSSI